MPSSLLARFYVQLRGDVVAQFDERHTRILTHFVD